LFFQYTEAWGTVVIKAAEILLDGFSRLYFRNLTEFNITQDATNNFDRNETEIRNSITDIHKFFRCHITQNKNCVSDGGSVRNGVFEYCENEKVSLNVGNIT